ncbi:hypothetical protein MA16_Dca021913 [Dendrobium catenatum]|uniref:RNase H type-1 domain-containing protein n=1 Tax=Dendrobium catenatum TaxID=906689 RepID=A0A2I0VT59_9ASPA|nr:hypothetical protein MA16_Dca021913 [Dendrobium catenatum]
MDDGFMVTNAITYASTSFSYIHPDHWNANQQMLTPYSWHPPPPGWIKINIDAALHCSYNAGIGGILRDHRGRMLLAYRFSLVQWDIGKLEWLAVRSIGNIIEDWKLKSKGIIVEGDNYNVMKHFKNLSNLDKRDSQEEKESRERERILRGGVCKGFHKGFSKQGSESSSLVIISGSLEVQERSTLVTDQDSMPA